MKGSDLAKRLGIEPMWVDVGGSRRRLAAGWLAGQAAAGVERFCGTADVEPAARHVPRVETLDMPDAAGRRTWATNNDVARYLAPFMRTIWADVSRVDGVLPFRHAHYLKLFQMSDPRLPYDRLMVDEAQDLNPCMAAIVGGQTHLSRTFVGDSNQQIYGWNGAVDAMDSVPADRTVYLTRSFRFGPAIAEAANAVLGRLDTPMRIEGWSEIDSRVAPIADGEPIDAVLCRSNAEMVEQVIEQLEAGRRVGVQGGVSEIVRFAQAAQSLQDEGWTSYPDLACFRSWGEVGTYVEEEPAGSELSTLYRLVNENGAAEIAEIMKRADKATRPDVVISTAHKAKGCEWGSVRLAADFPPRVKAGIEQPVADEELRLLYVAITRAKQRLDAAAHPWFQQQTQEEEPT